jgi:hypothetical protein
MTAREVYSIARRVNFGKNLAGVGLNELVPERDKDGKSARLASGVASRALGAGNPRSQHGGYDPHEKKQADAEKAEIQEVLGQLRGDVNTVSNKVDQLGKMDRRHFLITSLVLGAASTIAAIFNSKQRPLLIDDAVFKSAVVEYTRAKRANDHGAMYEAGRTMQSLVHLALKKAGNDRGLKEGIWSAVRNILSEDAEYFEEE